MTAGGGLVTLGETMALVAQAQPGAVRNGEPMTLGIGGAESNVAIAVRRLGVPATWIGRVGDDPAGRLVVRELLAEGVAVVAPVDPAPTGLMVRWRPAAARGRVAYYRRESAGSHLDPSDLPADVVAGADVVHLTGITPALGERPARAVEEAIRLARQGGARVSVDLNYRRALWPPEVAGPALRRLVAAADVVFAGAEEAELALGAPPVGSDRHRAHELAEAMVALGPSQAVIKLGAAGCVGRVDGSAFDVPARAVTVVDTVGAGDAFVAGYLAELIAGVPAAGRFATAVAAGALAASVPGDWEGSPRREDLVLLEASEPVIR